MRVDLAPVKNEYLEKKLEHKKLKEQYWYTWGDEMAVMDDKIAVVDEQISYLGKLMDDNGVVCSELNGLISVCRVVSGNKTTEEAAFVITEKSEILVALPGGVGTLDEIFHVIAAASIGYHQKKVIFYNEYGFYNELLAALKTLEDKGFARQSFSTYYETANNLDELKEKIN